MMKIVQPRTLNLRKTLFVGLVILGLMVWSAIRKPAPPVNPMWQGSTMGTTYTIRIAHSPLGSKTLQQVQKAVENYLAAINDQMSTYLPSSEISRFNRSTETTPFPVSPDFARVVTFALQLSRDSDGAFDPTVTPLVNAWGFGSQAAGAEPAADQLEAALARVGYRYVTLTPDGALRKSRPDVQLDLSAVAKGYAVDGVAALLMQHGATNIFVEIGGECVAHGQNDRGHPWRIGIDRPAYGALPGENLEAVVELSHRAIATSGDYRNFRATEDGTVVNHIIDPRTGRPAQHQLASVSVLATNCLEADGIATALFVMGPDEGLAWATRRPDVEALFVVRTGDGFKELRTPGFKTSKLDENPAAD